MRYNLRNKKEFAKNLLGPIFHEYCERLSIYLDSFNDKDSIILFVSRDGLRIRYLYELFMKNKMKKIQKNIDNFYISRISVINSCLNENLDDIAETLSYVLDMLTVKDFLKVFLDKDYNEIPKDLLNKNINSKIFKYLINSEEDYGKDLRRNFKYQSFYFKKYLKGLIKNNKNIVLIDSGWQGSTQAVLMKTFKEYNFIGLYFGKWDYWDRNHKFMNKVYGISIEDNNIKNNFYRSSILYYHQLIEEILEPKIPTLKRYRIQDKKIFPEDIMDLSKIRPQSRDDEYFNGIIEYFNENKNLSSLEIHKRANSAFKVLSRKIIFPSKKDIMLMSINPRPADFKENIFLLPVIKDRTIKTIKEKKDNIFFSLWKQAQIRYEFPIIWPIVSLIFHLYTIRSGKILFI